MSLTESHIEEASLDRLKNSGDHIPDINPAKHIGLHDALLPKLISGEVRIGKAERLLTDMMK